MSDSPVDSLPGPPAPSVWPTVSFTDVDAGLRLLTEGLGFVVTALHRDEDGTVAHGEARSPDGGGVMFGSRGKPGAWGALGPQGVYVVAAEPATVDALSATSAGALLVLVIVTVPVAVPPWPSLTV